MDRGWDSTKISNPILVADLTLLLGPPKKAPFTWVQYSQISNLRRKKWGREQKLDLFSVLQYVWTRTGLIISNHRLSRVLRRGGQGQTFWAGKKYRDKKNQKKKKISKYIMRAKEVFTCFNPVEWMLLYIYIYIYIYIYTY